MFIAIRHIHYTTVGTSASQSCMTTPSMFIIMPHIIPTLIVIMAEKRSGLATADPACTLHDEHIFEHTSVLCM